jgi:hypothetical protein
MKDIHSERSSPGRIPILSPTVHCVAMTALVYLRSSFGFVFLRPKSVFFAFTWAFVLFDIVAWNEPGLWHQYRAVCIFGTGAAFLYWLHLSIAVSRELYRAGEHDLYSGTSHLRRLMPRGEQGSAAPERNLHLWGEPATVLVLAGTLRFAFAEHHLSTWLVFTAACMVCKEGMNYWFTVRRDKIKDDMIHDAKEQGDTLPDNQLSADAPKATRKEPVRRKRNAPSAEEAARERKFAELLRLRAPFNLEKAEENYRTLIRLEHPDVNQGSAGSDARAAELNEAIDFFRDRLRG